jgi:uncharacterized secreted protein with C-terminal beta-propeller domain
MRSFPVLVASLALVGAACSGGSDETSTPDPHPSSTERSNGGTGGGAGGGGQFLRGLAPFDDCGAFLEHIKDEARARVGPYGLESGYGGAGFFGEDVVFDGDIRVVAAPALATPDLAPTPQPTLEATTGPRAAPNSNGDGAAGDFTGTNVQELGIDEPDIVKTDGRRILTISNNVLSYIDAANPNPSVTSRVQLPEGWDHQLFFGGDRALVVTNGGSWGYPLPVEPQIDDAESKFSRTSEFFDTGYFGPSALIFEIDLSDPANISIAASMRIEGQYLSARAIGTSVRLAVSSTPNDLPWVFPQSQAGEERATEANQDTVDKSSLDDWVPSFDLATSTFQASGPLLECDRLHRPGEFSGFEVISVLDLDIGSGLADGFDTRDAVGVLAGGQTIYSSNDRFYVATTRWAGTDLVGETARREWADNYETDIHAFSIAPGEPTEYVASGSISGTLLNQFSLDEHDGYLRAITTDGTPWDGSNRSETQLVVMEEQRDELAQVGRVGGIGRGETLYSARLLDDVGFAVTFRQVDPFYVLDLTDPANPEIAGELKIPGFSTYLHPLRDDRVLGVGQDANENGGTLGLKLSLFDVSDPSDPREISKWILANANSPVEFDPRAFQIIGSTAIVPVQTWSGEFSGAILFDIGDEITEIGRISHDPTAGALTSDCRPIGPTDVPEASELFFYATDGFSHLQFCQGDDTGGYGSWYCDWFGLGDASQWFYNGLDDANRTFDQLDASQDDRFEICRPQGDTFQEALLRTIVIGETIWTMSPAALQANDLNSLNVIAKLDLY